jgi:uncharacterized alpha-E superfamily protein
VRYCVGEVSHLVSQLIYTFQLTRGDTVAEAVDVVHRRLEESDIGAIIGSGTHEFLDKVQLDLNDVSGAIASAYFGQDPPP